MPFNVRLATHDSPHLPIAAKQHPKPSSGGGREFIKGICFGIGILTVLLVASWLATSENGAATNIPAFFNYLLTPH